jgi:glycerol-3-phosphate acyltransferase PlsX
MSLVLDAMGGDYAPEEILKGAIQVAPELNMPLILVGDPSKMARFLPRVLPSNVHLHPAAEEVGMDEKPTDAFRNKKDSSLMIATKLVKDGQANAMVSAGNTGACTAFALLLWRQIPGIHRPAIASRMPNRHGGFVLLDAGASPDVEPEHMVEFATMGRAYAKTVMGRPEPQVHLLNIGEEDGKGNAFAKQAYSLLKRHPWFEGNIEGKDMFAKPCDVVVCDAFVGNIVLKTGEGVAELILNTLRDEVPANPLIKMFFWPVKRVTAPLRRMVDYAEIGGSPLLGLNGLCFICHGRSDARAIRNALLQAQAAVQNGLNDAIREALLRD